jgi:protein AroM
MLERITFLTIGQTPRSDLVPEIVAALPRAPDVREWGVLDGVDGDRALAALEPDADDHALVTRLRSGKQAVIGKRWVAERIQARLDESTPDDAEVTVLLCTGDFGGLRARGFFLDAQHLVDHGVEALCHGADSIGVLVPLGRQEGEHHYRPTPGQEIRTAHASPYDGSEDFRRVGRTLAACDVVVMHCMGYTEAQRAAVASGTGRPVLLARRLVASALANLL